MTRVPIGIGAAPPEHDARIEAPIAARVPETIARGFTVLRVRALAEGGRLGGPRPGGANEDALRIAPRISTGGPGASPAARAPQ